MAFGWRDPETPGAEEPDRLDVGAVEHPFRFSGEGVGGLVIEAVDAMGGVGPDAEERYQRALTVLRERADEVVELLSSREGLGAVPEQAYLDRWSLVQLLGELEHPAAIRPLADILAAPVPQERSEDPHSFSTVREEVVIRTTAVDALERLGRQGEADAREVLRRHVDDDQRSVRRACVQALIALGDRDDLARVRRTLERRDEAWLLEVRRTDVRHVPQAPGGMFLAPPDERGPDRPEHVPVLDDAPDQHPGLDAVLDKARRLAAYLLRADESDVVRLPDGRFGMRDDPRRALTIEELAEAAADPTNLPEGMDPGLDPE